jgi:GWxTD domain-containing protein
MRVNPTLLVVLLLTATIASAADPNAAIAAARKQIHDGRFTDAVKTLQEAVPNAVALPDSRDRTMALAALHFYTAVAFTGLDDEWKTKEELEQFFHFSPQTNSIDPSKFDKRLVGWFREVSDSLKQEQSSNFDLAYPGYESFADLAPKARSLTVWGDGPELTLLGTRDEKAEWHRLADDAARQTFIDAFWTKRDPQLKQSFLRRVAFADRTFANEKSRGSMTDRGRVFVLFGPPRIVRQKPLSPREAGSLRSSGPAFAGSVDNYDRFKAMEVADMNITMGSSVPIDKANMERWVYGREQLPKSVAEADVVFKFVTQEGYGDHVLQRDFLVVKALHDAVAP